MDQPLILTVQLDEKAQAFYADLRERYFPPARNVTPAHLTLFHQLPDEDLTYRTLAEAAHATPRSLLSAPDARSTGRGVAIFFQAASVNALHANLSAAFENSLVPQDRQRLRPHIVVQNKVTPETARHTLLQLKTTSFVEPYAIGLTLWRYLGGPWERLLDFPFQDLSS